MKIRTMLYANVAVKLPTPIKNAFRKGEAFNRNSSLESGKIHEHARIYRLRSVAGSQILNFMS